MIPLTLNVCDLTYHPYEKAEEINLSQTKTKDGAATRVKLAMPRIVDKRQLKQNYVILQKKITNPITSANLPSQLQSEHTPPGTASISTTEVLPSTSAGNTGRYVIPKVPRSSLKSNILNDLVAKISPPARPILPRPSSLPGKSPPRKVSGTRPTKRRV